MIAPFTLHRPQDVLHFVSVAAANPFLWFALICVFTFFCIWTTILSKVDLSVAVPVASFSYVAVPMVSIFFLKEHIPILRWVGIFFILLGVIFVSISSHRQEAN